MNDSDLEKILRGAPRPTPPDGLLEDLLLDRTPAASAPVVSPPPRRFGYPRWFPEFALALLAVGSFVTAAMQSEKLEQLQEQNAALQMRLDSSAEANPGTEAAQTDDLNRLQKDNDELHQLEQEVIALKAQLGEFEKLRADHQRLSAGGSAHHEHAPAKDLFGEAQENAASIKCINHLKQIGLAARIWATDHQDILPPDFLTMKNELATPKILVCPSDTVRADAPMASWAEFHAGLVSYVMHSPSVSESQPEVVYVQCPVHGHVCLADGSVQQPKSTGRQVVDRNGRKVLSQ
jgi:hypothetical protein